MSKIKDFISHITTFQKFKKINASRPPIILYSEMASDALHFKNIIKLLLEESNIPLIYLSSTKKDALEDFYHKNLTKFYIGEGLLRTILFKIFNCKLFITSMPDLESFHLKKSVYPVHYLYIFHSIVSTFMIYRHKAFDAYDTIFCVGEHHIKEIRKTEEIYNLKKKNLISHGYSRLDQIRKEKEKFRDYDLIGKQILIAPTWGENSISNMCAQELIKVLLENDFKVIFRPHPMTVKNESSLINKIIEDFTKDKNFIFEDNHAKNDSFYTSDLLISDWSGVAFEFSFGLEKPVLFIDVPKKVNNEQYSTYQMNPMEEVLREKIGAILKVKEIFQAPIKIRYLLEEFKENRELVQKYRNEYIFNVGESDKVAVSHILNIVQDL